jgi:hypothetical protein
MAALTSRELAQQALAQLDGLHVLALLTARLTAPTCRV